MDMVSAVSRIEWNLPSIPKKTLIFEKIQFQFRMEYSYLFKEKQKSCFQGKFVLVKYCGKLSCWIFPMLKGSATWPNSGKLLELPCLQTLELDSQLLELLLQLVSWVLQSGLGSRTLTSHGVSLPQSWLQSGTSLPSGTSISLVIQAWILQKYYSALAQPFF